MNKNISLAIKGTAGALAAAFAFSFPLSANAENFYVDLGLGQAKADLGNTAGLNVDDKDTSYSIGAGYKFNDNIAIEGGYLKLGTASISASDTVTGTYYGKPYSSTGSASASSEVDGYYLGPVISLPMGDKFEAYARAGVYFWNADSKMSASGTLTYAGTTYAAGATATRSDSGNDGYYGIGAAYKATKNVSVGADWTRYDIGGVDVDNIGARLKYAF